jgi:hypothetical protein
MSAGRFDVVQFDRLKGFRKCRDPNAAELATPFVIEFSITSLRSRKSLSTCDFSKSETNDSATLGSWSFSSRRSALRPDVPGKEEILALISDYLL